MLSLFGRCALGVCAALVLSCCSGSHPPSSVFVPEGVVQPEVTPGHSWMAPSAAQQDLAYISDAYTGYVTVLSFPGGRLLGQLTGLKTPQGECVDAAGDVWIVLAGTEEIVEYSHGGTKQIAKLKDPGRPSSCTIDPTSGDLAVANWMGPKYTPGYVAIYPHAKGPRKVYIGDGLFHYMVFCGYGGTKENLFVEGTGGPYGVSELRRDAPEFHYFTVSPPLSEANLQWDGKHLAVGVQGYASSGGNSAIYQVQIRQRYRGTVVGMTQLLGSISIEQFSIQGANVVGADWAAGDVGFWKYPSGGAPTKIVYHGFVDPFGAAVSMAQSRRRLKSIVR